MSEFDDKLNSILSNPQMMQQIMSLAQSLNQNSSGLDDKMQAGTGTPRESQQSSSSPGISPSMLGKLSSIMQHGTIDQNQQSLLKALSPYLSRQKLQKLERAMHAAKMAGLASELTNTRNQSYSGR